MFQFAQNEATNTRRRIFFYAVDATDGFTAVTASITSGVVLIVKNGVTPGTSPVSPTFTHISNGLWYYEMTASHLDTQGVLTVTITGSNIRTVQLIGYVYAGDPMASIPTFPTNFSSLSINASGQVTVGGYGTGLAPLQPTVAGRTLDVTTTGEAGIDWGNIGSPTTAVAFTNTTISTGQQIASVSGSVNSVATRVTANTDQWNGIGVTGMPMPTYTQPTGFLSASFPAGTIANTTNITAGTITTVSGNVNGSVNSVTNAVTVGTINNNVITAASIATDAIDADAIANSAITVRLDTDAVPSEARLVTGTVASDVYNALLSSYTLPNTFGSRLVRTRSTSPSNETFITSSNHIAADVHDLQPAVIEDIHFADSALVIGSAAGTGVKAYLSTAADEGIADTVLNRNIAGGGNGTGATTDRTVRSALRALRNKSGIVGTTLTVYQEDDTATAWTASVSSSATADPVTGIDPT